MSSKRLRKILLSLWWIFLCIVCLRLLQQYEAISFRVGNTQNDTPWTISSSTYTWSRSMQDIQPITGTLRTCPWECDQSRYQDIIASTQHQLYGRLYHLTLDDIRATRKTLGEKGVNVDIILEDERFVQYHDDFRDHRQYFSWTSVQLHNDFLLWVNYTHAKTFLTDTHSIIQTANLTHSSFEKNIEHFFFTQDKEIHASLQNIFVADRSGEDLTHDMIHPNLLVCPTDCKNKIITLLQSAQQSIQMQQQYISDDEVLKALKQAERKGIAIDISLPDNENNQLTQSRFRPGTITLVDKPYIHSKTILIDERYLLIWSMNMSSNSLENNREIGVITTYQKIIEKRKKDHKNVQ